MVSNTLGIVLGLLTLIALVASSVAVARASLSKSTIEVLKGSNEALTERVALLEQDNTRQATQLAALKAENSALQTYVSGTDAIKNLAVGLAKQDTDRGAEHHDILASIQLTQQTIHLAQKEIMALLTKTYFKTHTHS